MRREIDSPQKLNFLCEFLNKIWADGWLDEFSNEHFLIKAMENRIEDFHGKDQLIENNAHLFSFGKDVGLNFVNNFSSKLAHLCKEFGEDKIKGFVENQLSAGKQNYDEDQFFRALSEVEVLKFYSTFVCSANRVCIYEPPISENGKNPEARFIYDNKITVDVEVKTPGFSNERIIDKLILSPVVLSDDGRLKLQEFCNDNGVRCIPPRLYKLVDFLNSAAVKFEKPISDKHLNLLFINWTYSEFPSKSFLEAVSILNNQYTGFLNHQKIAYKFGVINDVFTKVSAIIIYTSSINNLVFQDFRYLWATRNFSIIPLDCDVELLARVTQMDYKNNRTSPTLLADFKDETIDEKVDARITCLNAMKIIEKCYLR